VRGGGIPLYRGSVGDGRFLDVQDTSAYVAPSCVLQPPASWSLHHAEPFGPLDSVVVVDTRAELVAAMNASNGSLVASIATDDVEGAPRCPRSFRPSRSASTSPAAGGIVRRCSAGSVPRGRVPSSVAICSCRRSPTVPKDPRTALRELPSYSRLPPR
jgi:hypothetical protein